MIYQLDYHQLIEYSMLDIGITVPVNLVYGQHVMNVEAKLDTGAQFSLFERICADRLGIAVESGHPMRMSTLTGDFLAYGHELTLITSNLSFDLTAYFAADYSVRRNLLGRTWLQRVRIGLVDHEGKLYLSAYDEW